MANAIEVDPSAAAPGAILTMRFPTHVMRGSVYPLRDADAPDDVVVWLVSGRPGGREPTSSRTRPATLGIGLNGPGPELVRLPDDLPAGVYRLCIDGPADAPCVEIEVRDDA